MYVLKQSSNLEPELANTEIYIYMIISFYFFKTTLECIKIKNNALIAWQLLASL